jgi:hypothetical protein
VSSSQIHTAPPVPRPQARTPLPTCIHLGPVSEPCACGDPRKHVYHCLCDAVESGRCYQGRSTNPDVQGCLDCTHYTTTAKETPVAAATLPTPPTLGLWIITCPGRERQLARTIASLRAGGWEAPIGIQLQTAPPGTAEQRWQQVADNTLAALRLAYDSAVDYAIVIQDDVLACRGFNEYIRSHPLINARSVNGMSLSRPHQIDLPFALVDQQRKVRVAQPHTASGGTWPHDRTWGAQGFVYSRAYIERAIRTWPKGGWGPDNGEDGFLNITCEKLDGALHYTLPNLITQQNQDSHFGTPKTECVDWVESWRPGRKRLILSAAMGKQYDELGQVTYPRLARYADRIGADFHVLREARYPRTPWDRLRARHYLDVYERVLWVDADVVVRDPEACPDIFDAVPEQKLGVRNELPWGLTCHAGAIPNLDRVYREALALAGLPYSPFKYSFNTGVMVVGRSHAGIWDIPPRRSDDFLGEQAWANAMTRKHKIHVHDLGTAWNCPVGPPAADIPLGEAHFIHLLGLSHVERMRWIHANRDKYRL